MRRFPFAVRALPRCGGTAPRPRSAFGLCLRHLREARGLTQQALAERAGLSVSYIHRLERGVQRPSVRTVRKLETALGMRLLGPDPPAWDDWWHHETERARSEPEGS